MKNLIRRLLALACALSVVPAFAAATLAPGASLKGLITLPSSELRYGINGAPAGPFGVLPSAPSTPGKHWLVTYGRDQQVLQWARFEVTADLVEEVAASRVVPLLIDAEPPIATVLFPNTLLPVSADPDNQSVGNVLGGQARIHIEATDRSGGVTAELLVDGKPLPAGVRFQENRQDGRYQLAVRTRDALGNQGERAATHVQLDTTPPTLAWQRLDANHDLPADVFDGKRARLLIRVGDVGSGVRSLRMGKQQFDQQQLAGGVLELKLDADSLAYELKDRVGNAAAGEIALRADNQGPQITAKLNDEPINLESATITHRDTLQLDAEDALSGVARACVEVSNGIHSCRSLPLKLSGMTPASYVVEFRAVDRMGNGNVQLLSFEVLP